jgi:hypothetical protein
MATHSQNRARWPLLRLYRKRLIWSAVWSTGVLALAYFAIVGQFNVGAFPHPAWNRIESINHAHELLLVFSVICYFMGEGLGSTTGGNFLGLPSRGGFGPLGDTRFLLTRPVPRSTLLVQPFALIAVALAVIPLLSIPLLAGGLWLVHASSLQHLADVLSLASASGASSSTWSLLDSVHFWRFYVAAVSVGWTTASLMMAQRWLLLSGHRGLEIAGALVAPVLFYGFMFLIRSGVCRGLVLMWPESVGGFGVEPSISLIVVHVAFALALLWGCWRTSEQAEI